MKSLREFVERSDAVVVRIFEDRGQILPMYHVVNGDGVEEIFIPPPGNKDESVAAVRVRLAEVKAKRVMFVDEAWTRAASEEEYKAYMETHNSLEHWDGRKENIIYMAEDAQEGTLLATREILRTEGQPPRLGPMQFTSHGVNSGRMVGLLPTTGKGH
jgi:hypothetical protein